MTLKVVVVGGGVVGAACAFHAASAGLDVTVVDRGPVGAGTTSRGEGNVLLSDKEPGPELDLARLSRALWDEAGDELGGDLFELEPKGGLVVARTDEGLAALGVFAARQARAGVRVEPVDRVRELEPHLAPGLPGGVHYPQDAQVQPVRAAVALLDAAVRRGARTGRPRSPRRSPAATAHSPESGRRPVTYCPPTPSSTPPAPGAARSAAGSAPPSRCCRAGASSW